MAHIRHLYDPSFVPVLGQAGWGGRHLFACRPLIARQPDGPLVAYGWLDPGGARLVGREEAAARGWADDDLESAAHASLGRRSTPDWRPLWLGVVPALACDGDEHVAAQLLRRAVRVDLQRRLRVPRVALAVPHRGAIVACDAEVAADADLAGLARVGFEAARVAGRGPVSPHLLVLEGGELTEVLSPRAAGKPPRRLTPKISKKGLLILRAACDSEEALVEAFGRELPAIARAVLARGGFSGRVKVEVPAEAFAAGPNRPMRVAAVEQLFRELAAAKGLRAPGGQRVRLRVVVGEQDDVETSHSAVSRVETSVSEVSRSSSTMTRRRRSSLLRQVVASSRVGRRRRSAG
ncbi:MAG: hypothetical protein M9894_23705 [Planctomycetes bacterium]|nr:hypothetical protein [Planctomycetota bacterium]